MKLTDEKLTQAARQVVHSIGNTPLPAEEPAFSPAFEEKMTVLLRQQRRKDLWKRIGCAAASILILLVMTGGIFLTLNTNVRAITLSWCRKVIGDRYYYSFTGNHSGEALPEYEITALPEGYTLYEKTINTETVRLRYRKPSTKKGYIIPMSLEYFWMQEGLSTILLTNNSSTLTHKQVTVNGKPADLYLENHSYNTYKTYKLLWMDEDSDLFFYLSARLSEEEIIAVAESVRPVQK